MPELQAQFNGWAIVEVMGHQVGVGLDTAVDVFDLIDTRDVVGKGGQAEIIGPGTEQEHGRGVDRFLFFRARQGEREGGDKDTGGDRQYGHTGCSPARAPVRLSAVLHRSHWPFLPRPRV